MRVLAACSLGGSGHFDPLLPFLEAARRAGHEVLVAGPPALREMVESAGLPFRAGGEPAERDVAPIREQLPIAPSAQASILANRELFGRLAARAMLPGIEQLWSEWPPDVVLRDPAEYASAVVAARAGTPAAQVAISLADVEAGSITTAAPALAELRRGLTGELRASPYVTRFPASLDPSPFPRTLRYRERLAPTARREPERPLIYVSFGTVLGLMSFAADVYRIALEAVRDVEAPVLLTVGRRFDRSLLTDVPEHVRVQAWADQAQVLEHAHVVVCHGGSGTTLGALAAGVPLVIVPLFADQIENARRIAETGAAVVVDARAALIAGAIREVLASASYRQRARSVAAEMAGYPSADDVLAALLTSGTPHHAPGTPLTGG